jgi:adenosine deaminase
MDLEAVRQLPKAVLHDHLDGGLRVETLIELAARAGYSGLPSYDPVELADAMFQGGSGSLRHYLDSFAHTVAVMQTAPAIEQVAYEAGMDHHRDGVVYAELRLGPSLLTGRGLSREEAIESALLGLRRAASETGLVFGLLISAIRQDHDSDAVAAAAVHYVGEGVVGFDLAGREIGYPPEDHLPALHRAREHGLGISLHAGEAAGTESIAAALGKGGAQRLGHGVRVIDDCKVDHGEITALGALATRVRDQRIPLEVAISSNIHTGLAPDAASHPFGMLYRGGFNVSINTDNRLMSRVSMSGEVTLAAESHDLTISDIGAITVGALQAGFGDWEQRQRLIDEVVAPAYAATT